MDQWVWQTSGCDGSVGVADQWVWQTSDLFNGPMNMYLFICLCFSEANHISDIAEAVQTKLDSYKADKRELGSVSYYF